jgi:guanylate kinase
MGKTLSGKSTTLKSLKKINVPSLITTTTRPKRTNEKNHVDYIFINDTEYQSELKLNNVIAPRKYNVVNNQTWYYFLNKSTLTRAIAESETNNVALIIDPVGYFELKDYLENQINDEKLKQIKIKGWYLDVSLKERMSRYLSSPRQNENPQEVLRRLYDDEFHAFKPLDDEKVRTENNITIVKNSMDLIEKLAINAIKDRIEEENQNAK